MTLTGENLFINFFRWYTLRDRDGVANLVSFLHKAIFLIFHEKFQYYLIFHVDHSGKLFENLHQIVLTRLLSTCCCFTNLSSSEQADPIATHLIKHRIDNHIESS